MAKIMYIITQGAWGGAQRNVFELASHFCDEHEVIVAVGEKSGRKDLQNKFLQETREMEKPKVKIIQLNKLQRAINPIKDIAALVELKKLITDEKPDIIHLHSSKAGIIGGVAAALAKNAKVSAPKIIYTAHGWVFNEKINPLLKFIYSFLERHTSQFKNKIIVLGKNEMEAGKKIGIEEEKMIIIQNAVQTDHPEDGAAEEREAARNRIFELIKREQDKNILLIGAIGSFLPNKGFDVLIDAFQKSNQRTKEKSVLTIIGGGKIKDKLEKKIKKYGLEKKIYLFNFLNDAEKLLGGFDIFIISSLKEGMPYVLLEAMNRALPVIATKTGVIPEIIEHDTSGLLAEPGNAEDLAEKIDYLADSEEKRKILGNEAKKTVKKFSIEKFFENVNKIYFTKESCTADKISE